ncbi:hypothetical protein Tco_1437931 [Tanacetum coccineum]
MKATMAWRCRACDDLVKDYLCVPSNPLSPPPPISDSEPEDVIKVEDTIEPEDETVSASVHEVGELSTASFHKEDSDGMLPGLMRRDINSLFGRMTSFSRRLCGRETTHALVKKKRKAKDEYYGKLILDLGHEVRSSVEEGTAAMENLLIVLLTREGDTCLFYKSNTYDFMMQIALQKKTHDIDGNVHAFKARLVAKGFTQTYKVDYGENFSLVADIRAITGRVCGSKTSQQASGSNVALLVLYADDILLMGHSVTMLKEVKSWLLSGQSAYLEKILKKFRMKNSKKGYTPMMEKPDYRKLQGAKTPTRDLICLKELIYKLQLVVNKLPIGVIRIASVSMLCQTCQAVLLEALKGVEFGEIDLPFWKKDRIRAGAGESKRLSPLPRPQAPAAHQRRPPPRSEPKAAGQQPAPEKKKRVSKTMREKTGKGQAKRPRSKPKNPSTQQAGSPSRATAGTNDKPKTPRKVLAASENKRAPPPPRKRQSIPSRKRTIKKKRSRKEKIKRRAQQEGPKAKPKPYKSRERKARLQNLMWIEKEPTEGHSLLLNEGGAVARSKRRAPTKKKQKDHRSGMNKKKRRHQVKPKPDTSHKEEEAPTSERPSRAKKPEGPSPKQEGSTPVRARHRRRESPSTPKSKVLQGKGVDI